VHGEDHAASVPRDTVAVLLYFSREHPQTKKTRRVAGVVVLSAASV